jgi:hypothetical protein
MSKPRTTTRTKPQTQAEPKTAELPLIDKKAANEVQVHIAQFNPNLLSMPSLAELTAIVFCMGWQSAPIFGKDAQGNLVNQDGGVLIPVQLAKFFALVPATLTNKPGTAPAEGAAG